jgi:hypothetical protein
MRSHPTTAAGDPEFHFSDIPDTEARTPAVPHRLRERRSFLDGETRGHLARVADPWSGGAANAGGFVCSSVLAECEPLGDVLLAGA